MTFWAKTVWGFAGGWCILSWAPRNRTRGGKRMKPWRATWNGGRKAGNTTGGGGYRERCGRFARVRGSRAGRIGRRLGGERRRVARVSPRSVGPRVALERRIVHV